MPEPTNPYESPADGDVSGEVSSGWISVPTHRVVRRPAALLALILLTVNLLTTLMAVASMLFAVVGADWKTSDYCPVVCGGSCFVDQYESRTLTMRPNPGSVPSM